MATGFIPGIDLIPPSLLGAAGTRIPFNQATAPVGWVADTNAALGDCSMRVNQGTAGTGGGSTAWSSWNFGGTFSVTGFTLSIAQLAAHNHVINIGDGGHNHTFNDSGHNHTQNGNTVYVNEGTGFGKGSSGGDGPQLNGPGGIITGNNNQVVGFNSASGSNITGSSNNAGSTAGIFPTYVTPQVKYTDFMIGIKS